MLVLWSNEVYCSKNPFNKNFYHIKNPGEQLPWSYFAKKKKKLTAFSSRKQPPEVFYKKCCPKQFAKLTGKHLWHFLFFNKVWGLKLYWERESGLGAFLLFFGNLRIPFYRSRTPTGDCLLALTNFTKNFILDVLLGSKYTFYMQC